jgi:hypothetical protein
MPTLRINLNEHPIERIYGKFERTHRHHAVY